MEFFFLSVGEGLDFDLPHGAEGVQLLSDLFVGFEDIADLFEG